ncbi:acid-sensing ion channel 5-like [Limulus polyphemus]|uniref:Acid-sensing ion channel 5-like n=1 Tax=Limulus polyphemus TaxID=6850 RepID=A0ABM1S246_LIMPO|nr:acid-sensing ion channel 5-like [Limulus polyphemus]
MYTSITIMDDLRRAEDADLPQYPAITLCTHSPFKTTNKTSVEELRMLGISLSYPFSNLDINTRTKFIEAAIKSDINGILDLKRNWNLDHSNSLVGFKSSVRLKDMIIEHSISCEEFFIECAVALNISNCCSFFRTVITPLGVCFTFSPNKTLQRKITKVSTIAVNFRLPQNSVPLSEEEGVTVAIHDPREFPSESILKSNVGIWPGMNVRIAFQLTQTDYTSKLSLLPSNIFRRCNNEIWSVIGKPYTKNNCEIENTILLVQEFCNCTLVITPSVGGEIRYCGSEDIITCFIPKARDIYANIHCTPACKEYTYVKRTSYTRLQSSNSVTRSEAMNIELMFKDYSYIQAKYNINSITDAMSEIGGSMGLLLGASIITATDIFLFFMKKTYQKFCDMVFSTKK